MIFLSLFDALLVMQILHVLEVGEQLVKLDVALAFVGRLGAAVWCEGKGKGVQS